VNIRYPNAVLLLRNVIKEPFFARIPAAVLEDCRLFFFECGAIYSQS